MKKKLFSILLSLAMVITMMPAMTMTAYAGDDPFADYTKWGDEELEKTSMPDASGNYILDSDITIDTDWTVPGGEEGNPEVTNLCLNGHVLLVKGGIQVNDFSELNIYDTEDNNQTHYFRKEDEGYYSYVSDDTTPITVTGGLITTDNQQIGIYITGSGTVNMHSGAIAGCTKAVWVGYSYEDSASFNMTGGKICYNYNSYNDDCGTGAAVMVISGKFTMTDGELCHNYADFGGAVGIDDNPNASFIMTGGKITDNIAAGEGGGVYVYTCNACVAEGTLVTLEDGSQKAVEKLKTGDMLRIFDHKNGKLGAAPLLYFLDHKEKRDGGYTLRFADGNEITAVGRHCFFEKRANNYIMLNPKTASSYIGHEFYNADERKWEKLESVKILDEPVYCYSLMTALGNNANTVTNGLLSSELRGIFDYDETLIIDEQRLAADIERFGLMSYENQDYFSKEVFDILEGQYLNLIIGRGVLREDEVYSLLDAYANCFINGDEEEAQTNDKMMLTTTKTSFGVDSPDGSLYFGGTAIIENNHSYGYSFDEDGELVESKRVDSNIFLGPEKKITFGNGTDSGKNGVPAPQEGMHIGVNKNISNTELETFSYELEEFEYVQETFPVQITTNYVEDYDEYIFSDNPAYYVSFNTDHLELDVLPTNWSLLADAMAGEDQGTIDEVFKVEDNASTGVRTIKLLKDISAGADDERLVVPAGMTIVLDLNGFTLDRGLSKETGAVVKGNVITVAQNGKLTIKDNSGSKTGKITGGTSEYGAGIITNGETILESGIIENCKAISDDYDRTFSKKGRGGAVYVTTVGKFTMTGGTIQNCSASVAGGGIYSCKDIVMTGGKITKCSVSGLEDEGVKKAKGGAVYLMGGANMTMTGGEISENTLGNVADTRGAGLYIAQNANVTLGGTARIRDNKISGTNTNSNAYLYDGVKIGLAIGEGAPKAGMIIGASLKTYPSSSGVDFTTNGTANDINYFFLDDNTYYLKYEDSHIKIFKPNTGEYAIQAIPTEHGTVVLGNRVVAQGTIVTLTVTSDEGYELDTLTVTKASGGTVAVTNNSFTMPGEPVTVTATFKESTEPGPTPPGPTPGPDPETTPAEEEYKAPVEGENTVNVNTTITDGKAKVEEISQSTLEEAVNPKSGTETTDTIVIDLSQAKQDVTAVELTKKTVENLADVVSSDKNAVETVTIQMKEATVEMDAKTLETISEEANGNTIVLVVDKTKEENLKSSQKETLSKFDVNKTFEAYFESNGQRITSFNGGKVVVGIKFTPEQGKKVENYKIYYIDDNGKAQKFASKYVDGLLKFTTTHFSDYAIVYEGTSDVLLLQAKTSGKKAIKLSWNAQDNATKYVVYGAKCGKSYKKLKTTTAKSYTVKKVAGRKLKAHKAYKFYVVSYDALGNKVQSRSIHFVTANTQGKYANVKSIKAKYDELLLSAGVTQKIGAKYKMYSGKKHLKKTHGQALKFFSNNTDVATVSSGGTVKAVGKGTATIYIQDIGGKYCKTKVTVE